MANSASRSSYSTLIHQFYDSTSTWLRLQSFGIRLKDEPLVRTLLRQNLVVMRIVYFLLCLTAETRLN